MQWILNMQRLANKTYRITELYSITLIYGWLHWLGHLLTGCGPEMKLTEAATTARDARRNIPFYYYIIQHYNISPGPVTIYVETGATDHGAMKYLKNIKKNKSSKARVWRRYLAWAWQAGWLWRCSQQGSVVTHHTQLTSSLHRLCILHSALSPISSSA